MLFGKVPHTHLSDSQISAYLNHSLSHAESEAVWQKNIACPVCNFSGVTEVHSKARMQSITEVSQYIRSRFVSMTKLFARTPKRIKAAV